MYIDLLVFPLLLFGANRFSGEHPLSKKKLIIYSSIILLLKTSLRSVTIGRDTSHYAGYFYESINTPLSFYISDFVSRYSTLSGNYDSGYYLIQKFVSYFIHDFNVYTFFMQSLFFFLPIGTLLYRYAKDCKQVCFSYVLLNALFMGLPMANARQVYAIGVCVCAYIFVQDKRYVGAITFLIMGYFFHMSSLLFVIPLVLSFLHQKYIKWIAVLGIALSPFTLMFPNMIIVFMGNLLDNEKYASYGYHGTNGGAITYITCSLLMSLFCLIALWNKVKDDRNIKQYFIMIALSSFFTPLIYSNGSMMRITMYFQLFFLIIMPMAIDAQYGKNRTIYYNMAIVLLIIMSLMSAQEYKFFWEENQDPWLNWS